MSSRYMDTNPHFSSNPQLGYPVPQQFDPKPWEYPPYPHANSPHQLSHPPHGTYPDQIPQPTHDNYPQQIPQPPNGNFPDQIPQPTHGNFPDQIPQSTHGNFPDQIPQPTHGNDFPDRIPQPSRIQPRARQSHPQPSPPKKKPPRSPIEMNHQPPFGPQRHHEPDPRSHLAGLPPPHRTPSQHRPKPPSQKPRPQHAGFEHGPFPSNDSLMYPTPSKTQPATRFGAIFCCILWLLIILAGFLVLVIYLVYRPQTPKFEISNAGLNAANLEMGTTLNVDLTVLANFSSPNSKGDVEFGYVTLHLYFNQQLIANQYIQPFSTVNSESKLVYVEMVASQVRLPSEVNQQFINQVQRNRIMFELDAIFHAKSNFRSLLRYSNWLYGKCIIEMTGPPTGVLIASKCRMKK